MYTVWKVLRASLWESLDSYSSVSTVPLNLQLAPLQFAAFPNSLCLRSSAYLHVVVETVLKWLSFISTGIELFPAFRGCRPRELAGSSRTCVACMMRRGGSESSPKPFSFHFRFFCLQRDGCTRRRLLEKCFRLRFFVLRFPSWRTGPALFLGFSESRSHVHV